MSVLKSCKKQPYTRIHVAPQVLSQNLNGVPQSVSIDGQMNRLPTFLKILVLLLSPRVLNVIP